MADEPIRFDRTPYKITYRDLKGETKTIRRVPPPKLHDALPSDIVEINYKHNDDFQVGDQVEVHHINPRHPNVVQVKDGDGRTAFFDYYDVTLKEEIALRDGIDPRDKPKNSRYLLWP